jgi:carbon-monoxide dehydrogenase small subunit
MAAAKLIEERPHPSIEEAQQAISGNLCRCTGYGRIFAAFHQVQQERADARA